MCLLPVPTKRPSALLLCKAGALAGSWSNPAISLVSLQGHLLFYRAPLAVPALHLPSHTCCFQK